MKAIVERIDNHKLTLEMEVPQKEVTKALDKAYIKLANQVNIPGFRKGKAPRKILEMRVGKEVILDEAFEILASPAYFKALDEHSIEPVTRPEIEVVTLFEDKPLVFKATVVVKPEVKLGEYKGLKIAKPVAEVTEDAVNELLNSLAERYTKMIVVEDAIIQNGDFAIIDFAGFVDGQPFQGGEAQGYPLMLGSGAFIPGFEEQLIGLKVGEEKEISVNFPAEYSSAELAGKAAVFKIKINDVKRKELPVIDGEFAKEVSEFNSLEELKTDLRNKLEETAKNKAETEFKNLAVKTAVDNAEVDIPEVMIEQRIENMLEDLKINLENRGSNLEQFLEYTKTDMAGLKEKQRSTAINQVKTDLLLETIAKVEAVIAEPEEIDAEVAEMAKTYQQTSPEEVKQIVISNGRQKALIDSVIRKKAVNIIVENAITE